MTLIILSILIIRIVLAGLILSNRLIRVLLTILISLVILISRITRITLIIP